MLYRADIETLEDLTRIWREEGAALRWTSPFVLPPCLNAWWEVFGQSAQPLIVVIREGEAVVGVAPLMLQDGTVRFLGDPEVFDYFDCITAEDKEDVFFRALFAHLSQRGLTDLDLGPVRPDAILQRFFSRRELPGSVECRTQGEDVFSELNLPGTWDEFLGALDGKQRHEVRRKLRRLHEAGSVRFRRVDDVAQLREGMDTFHRLFTMNRKDKAAFMTGQMASFFRALSLALAEEGLLRLFFLDMNEQPVASALCFDDGGTRYLYNTGYDIAFQGLSVGLMSIVLSLKAAIDEGLHTYNFLKGGEIYKYRLGGKETLLSKCRVTLG